MQDDILELDELFSYLPVGMVQESVHIDANGRTVHLGNWHLTVYPYDKPVCDNEWTSGSVLRSSRQYTAHQIGGCPSCRQMLYKCTEDARGHLVIPLSKKMAQLRAERKGYSATMPSKEKRIIR